LSLFLAALASASVLRHAVIVGANVGGSGLEPLRYAETDAQRFADLLVELGGFDPVYVTVLYAPSEAELKAALHAHEETAGSFDDDLFLFYYSGHADARGLRIGADNYDFEALRSDIRGMQSEVKLGVLDACRSGTITRLKGAQLSQPFMVDDRLAAEGEAWITAASADETAQESDTLRGSFFTHYLISGLRGAADRDDGAVTLHEAYDYAYARVVDHTGGTNAGAQHPNYDYRINGTGALALTRVDKGRANVTLPAELAGQVTVIRLPDRTPVAEVAKEGGAPVTLALAPGHYKVRVMAGKELREAEVMLADGARVPVSPLAPISAESAKGKGAVYFDVAEFQRFAKEHQSTWDKVVNPRDLGHSPLVAGGISGLIPGGGQMFNGQWGKGALYLASTFLLFGGSVGIPDDAFFTGSITGPDPLALGAAALYGASIADASWNANRHEERRPRGGGTLSTYAGWDPTVGGASPYIAGLSGEWLVHPNVGVGVDRLGWTRSDESEARWNFASRVSFGVNWEKFRPALAVSAGGRVIDEGAPGGEITTSEGSADAETSRAAQNRLVGVVGAGVELRWYVTPRYFIEAGFRTELEDASPRFIAGGGIGLHLGE